MTTQLAIKNDPLCTVTLPVSNPARGRKFHQLAVEFVTRFPVGSSVTGAEIDNWYLSEASEAARSAITWTQYTRDERKLLVDGLKLAGTHDRMNEDGDGVPFALTYGAFDHALAQPVYRVESTLDALTASNVPRAALKALEAAYRRIRHLMESSPPAEVTAAVLSDVETAESAVQMVRQVLIANAGFVEGVWSRLLKNVEKTNAALLVRAADDGDEGE